MPSGSENRCIDPVVIWETHSSVPSRTTNASTNPCRSAQGAGGDSRPSGTRLTSPHRSRRTAKRSIPLSRRRGTATRSGAKKNGALGRAAGRRLGERPERSLGGKKTLLHNHLPRSFPGKHEKSRKISGGTKFDDSSGRQSRIPTPAVLLLAPVQFNRRSRMRRQKHRIGVTGKGAQPQIDGPGGRRLCTDGTAG